MSETMRIRLRAQAPVAEVHRALTDPDALRAWFAEHVEVDLPHRYEFWGRYTPDGDAPHQRLLHVDDHTLRFSWQLAGVDTTVEIALEAEGPASTIISVSQTNFPGWEAAVNESGVLGQLQTFWALAIANLIDFVEGRELTARCDLTTPQMREEIFIGGAPGEVYDSLMDPAKFSRWFGAKVEIEPRVGGRWAMGGFEHDPDPAKLIELEPGKKVTMQWPTGWIAAWELEGSAGGTRLTFVQSGFDQSAPPYGAWMGWLSGIAELRRFHELADWRPVWLDVEVPGMPDDILTVGSEA
jgi:uncharacterized protein YndB with AHSA1/START domain